jgi:hypothetical protein
MCCPPPRPPPPRRGPAFAPDAANVTAAKQLEKSMSFAFIEWFERLRIKHPKMGKDSAKARVIEKNAFMVLTVFVADRSRARLPGCRRDCAADRRFKFQKRRQRFFRTHNETLSVAAMRISNPDHSCVGIDC